jgi:hypothetical protein
MIIATQSKSSKINQVNLWLFFLLFISLIFRFWNKREAQPPLLSNFVTFFICDFYQIFHDSKSEINPIIYLNTACIVFKQFKNKTKSSYHISKINIVSVQCATHILEPLKKIDSS